MDRVAVSRRLGELDTILRKNGVDLIRHGLEHVLQTLPSGAPVSLFNKLGHGELAGSIYAHEETELSFGSLYLGDILSRACKHALPGNGYEGTRLGNA